MKESVLNTLIETPPVGFVINKDNCYMGTFLFEYFELMHIKFL